MNDKTNETNVFEEEKQEQPERRRTVWVWIILGWALYSALGLIALWQGILVPLSDEQRQIVEKLGVPLVEIGIGGGIISTISIIVFILGAWDLFMLRVRAIKIYISGLLINIVGVIYLCIMIPNYINFLKHPAGWISTLFGFCILGIILLYAMRLKRRGLLQ